MSGIYYILAILSYVWNLALPAVRPGVVSAGLMALVLAELILRKRLTFRGMTDRLVAVYFVYNALSFVQILLAGLPMQIYFGEFAVSLFPMIFYYVGRGADASVQRFYRNFILAILIVSVLGILLQLLMPQFYIDFSYQRGFVSKADAATCRVRMDSVVGSTVLGFLAVAGMLAAIPFLKEKRTRTFAVLSMLVNFAAAFLSSQRAAMVVAILVVLYTNYLIFFVFQLAGKRYFFAEVGFFVLAFLLLFLLDRHTAMKFYYRLESLPGAIGQRSEQWVAAVNNMFSTWFGNGLGANGHRALGLPNTHVIADGGLVKLYCEQGVIGFSMFLYLLILALRKGSRKIGEYCAELGIILAALLQSIGSNTLAFQLATPIFWYAVGRIFAESESAETVRQK